MITRTWKNRPITPQSKNSSYNPFQWAKDFEKRGSRKQPENFFPEFITQMSRNIG